MMFAKTGNAILAEPITRVLPGWMSLTGPAFTGTMTVMASSLFSTP
jgi:hypothetical protein